MSASQNWNQLLEDAIFGKVLTALLDDGYRVEVCDQDGGGLFVYAMPDAGVMPRDGHTHWVRLVPGNGSDMIVDYTVNLNEALGPAIQFAASMGD